MSTPRTVFLARFRRLALVLLLLVGVVAMAMHWDRLHPGEVQRQVQAAGVLAPLVFVALFAVAAVLFVPATVMMLAGGALFGPWLGTLYNLAGSTLGLVIAFLVARYLARDWAERRAGHRLRQFMRGVDEEGWRFVLLVRLAGLPYFLLNYALGLTSIGVLPYAVASALGLLPSMAAITYAGHVGFTAIRAGDGVLGKLVAAIALVGLAALVPVVVRMLRRRRVGGQADR